MNTWILTLGLALGTAALSAAQQGEPAPNPSEIRVVPVDPTPEPNQASVRIMFPEDHQVKQKLPIEAEFRVENYPLGVDSEFPREKEIYNSPEGQSVHLVIDNDPYLEFNEALDEALDDFETDFEQTVEFKIVSKLQPGMHVIRAFPARSFGESLKGDKAFAASVFYYKVQKDNPDMDINKPFLTYNEPQGRFPYKKRAPILLDFYISNCQLSRDGYKVRLSIDGTVQRTLSQWVPHYIYGLSQGRHQVRLELLDEKNKVVPGIFNDVTRTIELR